MYNLFGGAVTLQNCGLMLPFDKSSTLSLTQTLQYAVPEEYPIPPQ